MNLRSQKTVLIIFVSLTGLILLAFQNCSPALWSAANSSSAKANHIDELLVESEKEIKDTKKLLDEEQGARAYQVGREVAADEEIELEPKNQGKTKDLKVKLRFKKAIKSTKKNN